MVSNIFLGISACSGSASTSLLKETGEVCNQGQSPQSPSPGSYILYDDHYDNFFRWSEIKAVFWSQICCMTRVYLCNHPLKRCRRWRSRPWTSKKSLRPIISSTQCDSCSGGVVLFCLKVPGIRRQTNGAFRWIMLNLVLGCSEALHFAIVNLTMRVFFHASEEIPFKSIYNCFSVDS